MGLEDCRIVEVNQIYKILFNRSWFLQWLFVTMLDRLDQRLQCYRSYRRKSLHLAPHQHTNQQMFLFLDSIEIGNIKTARMHFVFMFEVALALAYLQDH